MTLTAVALSMAVGIAVSSAEPMKTVKTKGRQVFRANETFSSNLRFERENITVSSGDMVQFEDKSNIPHTITIVNDQLATNWGATYICLAENLAPFGGGACVPTFNAHGFGATPVLNEGEDGLDVAGDSLWLPPSGAITTQISAPAGTTLHYTCALHPWMQGEITVVE
jgi:plastocyanin